jgi:hypothetical protein
VPDDATGERGSGSVAIGEARPGHRQGGGALFVPGLAAKYHDIVWGKSYGTIEAAIDWEE